MEETDYCRKYVILSPSFNHPTEFTIVLHILYSATLTIASSTVAPVELDNDSAWLERMQ